MGLKGPRAKGLPKVQVKAGLVHKNANGGNKMINLETEIGKIDLGKLSSVTYETVMGNENPVGGEKSLFSRDEVCLYFPRPNPLDPANHLMAMGYRGRGFFTIIGHWDDLDTDSFGLCQPGSDELGIEYLSIPLARVSGIEIAREGESLDPAVEKAVVAYAAFSNTFRQAGVKYNALEVNSVATKEVKAKYPQNLLDCTLPKEQVFSQLRAYLTGEY
jgi:hypothetical protein